MKSFFKHTGWKILSTLIVFTGSNGCRKSVEIDPPVIYVVSATAFASDNSAFAAVLGIYGQLMITGAGMSGGDNSISALTGLSGDELEVPANTLVNRYKQFYRNEVPVSSTVFWNELYNVIYACNSALIGIHTSTGMSNEAKQQLTGELKFMRSFLYFYAVNLFGDIPLALTTDYRINNQLSRSPKELIYSQIVQDLKDAQATLSDDYLISMTTATADRLTPNKQTATALLARVYLYLRDWNNAILQASQVIADTRYTLEPDLNKVFLKFSPEAIWQLQPTGFIPNTWDALYYYLAPGTAPASNYVGSLSTFMWNAFENGDNRKLRWAGISNVAANGNNPARTYYFPYKYKSVNRTTSTEYLIVFRLAEQYLIRAEAQAQLGDIATSAADLNRIRSRAGLVNTTATDKAALLSAIYHERQIELFSEWGHRWLDLKRTGNIDIVMPAVSAVKGNTWKTHAQLYPIPQNDILLNPNLTQNPGY